MCGWDTDCNVGNVATIMGVRNGLEAIDYDLWRKPVHDLLICSSVIGSLNIMDIPYGACYIAKLAYMLAGEPAPDSWEDIFQNKIDSCHFEFPGSTHSMHVRVSESESINSQSREFSIINSDETSYSGKRSLKVIVKPISSAEDVLVYKKVYYFPSDFHDSRYDPSFSPLVYPGQTIHSCAFIPYYGISAEVSLYIHDAYSGHIFESDHLQFNKGKWENLSFRIPHMDNVLIDEIGVIFRVNDVSIQSSEFAGFIDDLYVDGKPDYSISFDHMVEDIWSNFHSEISQFTRLKGLLYLSDGQLNISCSDFAETYTGRYDWKNYTTVFYYTPILGENHLMNIRVQGAMRSYAVVLLPNSEIAIAKNCNGYVNLVKKGYKWAIGTEYEVVVTVSGNQINVLIHEANNTDNSIGTSNGEAVLHTIDECCPYLTGSIGIGVRNGGHGKCRKITVYGV